MRILGIDPGSRATGYAVLEVRGASVCFVEAGALVIASARRSSLAARLGGIGAALEQLLDRCRPDETAVEDLFHATHARSALRLAHARGVILGVLARAELPIAEYSPLQVKKAVSGYGYAEKDALRGMLEGLLRIPGGLLSRDASDATAVALCHAQAIPLRDAVAAAEREMAAAAGPPAVRKSRLAAAESDSRPLPSPAPSLDEAPAVSHTETSPRAGRARRGRGRPS